MTMNAFWRTLFLGPLWKWLDRVVNGEVVVTTTMEGEFVCLTRQDKEGNILDVMFFAANGIME